MRKHDDGINLLSDLFPTGAKIENVLIQRDLYSLSLNGNTKFADWVAYRLDSARINGENKRRNWSRDPLIDETMILEPEDYNNAYSTIGTDRGHFAPLGSLDGNDAWYETNYLSNISPQKSGLNRGPWRYLEAFERKLIEKLSVQFVYVITGSLYEKEMPGLPSADEPHVIPSGYWKIIVFPYDLEDHQLLVFGFILSQEDDYDVKYQERLVTVDEIESRSGLDLFTKVKYLLPEEFESHQHWNLLKTLAE